LCLSKESQLKSKVPYEIHDTPIDGHSGFTKTYDWVKRSFFCDGIKQYINNFVAECDVCQQNKGETIKSHGKLKPLLIPPLFAGIYQWILLWDYLNQAINQSSWWSLIIFPGMLISSLFNTHLPPLLWINVSWIRSSRFMP
jgi:hypothetical protein